MTKLKILKIHALWPEKSDFSLERNDTGDEYIFIHFYTPVLIWENGLWNHVKGNCFVVYDKHTQQLFKADNISLIHDWMHLSGNLDNIMRKADIKYNKVYMIHDGEEITNIMQDLEKEFLRCDIFSKEIQNARISELFMRLGRQVYNEPVTLTRSVVQQFTAVRTEIHKNYFKLWRVEDMAKLIHISPSRFYDLYKKIFAISPKKDLQYIRIEHAKQMLLQDKLSIKEIAVAVGYENEYYFIRKFKNQIGTTPGNYKKTVLDNSGCILKK